MKHKKRHKPPFGQIVILFSVVAINLFVLCVGAYFFYDQVVAPAFHLKSPEQRLAQAVTVITSAFRDPAEQIVAMDKLEILRTEVDRQLYNQAISTIDNTLPGMTIAAEVIDHWVALHHARVPLANYANSAEILADWRAEDPQKSAARQRFWMTWDGDCTASTRLALQKTMDDVHISEIEKQVAAGVLARWSEACGRALGVQP